MLMNSVSGSHGYFDSKQVLSECNLALDAWSIVVDVTAFDGWDRLYPGDGCFGSSQGSEALAIIKQSLHGRVTTLNQATTRLFGTDRGEEHAQRVKPYRAIATGHFSNNEPAVLNEIALVASFDTRPA